MCIVIYDGQTFREFSIAWYDYLLDCIVPYHSVFCSGGNIFLKLTKPGFLEAWQRMIWFSKLHKHTVWTPPDVLQIAKDRGWEIYELSNQEKEIIRLLKEADPLRGTKSKLRMSLFEKVLTLGLAILITAIVITYRNGMPKVLQYILLTLVVLFFLTIILG